MADQDDELPQDDAPEPEQRLFTLTEAERARQELEPFLVEAMECRKKLSGLDNDLSAVAARIMMMGGVIVPYEALAKLRREHTRLRMKDSPDASRSIRAIPAPETRSNKIHAAGNLKDNLLFHVSEYILDRTFSEPIASLGQPVSPLGFAPAD